MPRLPLVIDHQDQAFILRRHDGTSADPVTLPSPYQWPVENRPNSNLMAELRWYLEQFLDYPFPPETTHAEAVLDALKSWGTACFNQLFDRRDASTWLNQSNILQIRSDDPHTLSWPWEALYNPQSNYLAHERQIERCVNKIKDPPALPGLPQDRVNILLVVARPYEGDVRFRSIARPLIDLIKHNGLPAHVDLLRPPTFDQLRQHLREKPNFYHVIHFDGHGAYGAAADGSFAATPYTFQKGPQGCLVFEDAKGEPDPKSAADLSTLLREHPVPAVVLNADQAGMMDQHAEDAFASVATALLKSGVHSIVAMAYSLHVSGAQVFLPAFYSSLFEKGSIAEAVRAGRQQMLAQPQRVCVRGRHRLEDWLLPVLYQEDPYDFTFAAQAPPVQHESRFSEEVSQQKDPYGFIGRDGAILELERALHRNTPAILIQGLGGVGKTTLARGFLRWLDDTGGLDAALWFDFRDIRTAEYVLNRTGQMFYGDNFAVAKNKVELLGTALGQHRVLMVWDNFESAATNLTGEDRASLGQLLDAIRGKQSKVIITSRSPEDWLRSDQRWPLSLRGLDGEERWEYCDAILADLNLKINRDDEGLGKLMDQLAGHPLALRVVLPMLQNSSAAQITASLRTNIKELGLNEAEEQGRLFATLRYVEQGLAPELRPLLALVGLHESYIDADYLELVANEVDPTWTRALIDRLMSSLAIAGLLRDIGNATYEIHPLLTSFLRSVHAAKEPAKQAFVDVMGNLANALGPKEEHEQRIPFLLHGGNFNFALELAEQQNMDQDFAALTQSLAAYALNCRDFSQAARLSTRLATHWVSRKNFEGEAAAYHQLGMLAEEERDFAGAREWYLKSLGIKEKRGNLQGAASTYHQLGSIAEEERNFAGAREWYLKSLTISEKQGNLHYAASTYHQLGMLAEEECDYAGAREWYLKSLGIKEKQGNLHGAAITYHQLGIVAQKESDFAGAREWYLKSLAIKEKQGNLHGAASTYHQLGRIAEEERDFAGAREWYLKSLAIEEKQGNLHGAAGTYGEMGITAGQQGNFMEAGQWLVRSISSFTIARDQHSAIQGTNNFLIFHQRATPEDKQKLEALWRDANLGPFPTPEPPPQGNQQ